MIYSAQLEIWHPRISHCIKRSPALVNPHEDRSQEREKKTLGDWSTEFCLSVRSPYLSPDFKANTVTSNLLTTAISCPLSLHPNLIHKNRLINHYVGEFVKFFLSMGLLVTEQQKTNGIFGCVCACECVCACARFWLIWPLLYLSQILKSI